MSKLFHTALLAAFVLVQTSDASAEEIKISWSIENNFRVLRTSSAQDDFGKTLANRIACKKRVLCQEKLDRKARRGNGNLRLRYEPETLKYDAGWYDDKNRQIKFTVGAKLRDANCKWRRVQMGEAPSVFGEGATITKPLQLGTNRIEVECEVGKKRRPAVAVTDVKIQDIKIIALGDSYMSGEGSPHTYRGDPAALGDRALAQHPAQWLDHRCHSSTFSSTGIAAFQLAESNKQISVTYANLACSGAEIHDGIMTRYAGRVPVQALRDIYKRYNPAQILQYGHYGKAKLPSQIDQAKAIACSRDGCTPPDYLFVLTGGNELGFASIVADFAKGCDAECLAGMQRNVTLKLDELDQQYTSLNGEFKSMFAGVPAKNTVLLQYPNPMQNQSGSACVDSYFSPDNFTPSEGAMFGFGISKASSRFAKKNVLIPLNLKLKQFAEKFGWRHITSIQDLSQYNGYCADKRWFNTLDDSFEKQDVVDDGNKYPKYGYLPTGAMHPNIFGHTNIAAEIKRCFEVDGLLLTAQNRKEVLTCPRIDAAAR